MACAALALTALAGAENGRVRMSSDMRGFVGECAQLFVLDAHESERSEAMPVEVGVVAS